MHDHGHGHGGGGDHGHGGPPEGIAAITALPNKAAADAWERIVLPDGLKQRLLNWAILTMRHGPKLPVSASGLQRLLLFSGPPGTGKTTTARGLANAAVEQLGDIGSAQLIEIDPHALPSDMLGQSQRNVAILLQRSIPELVSVVSRAVVLIDEVEAFAVRRSAASFETNPADLHRATDAVLAGLDQLAADWPNVLFLATTNFAQAVDEAVLSRADWVVSLDLPDRDARESILRTSLRDLGANWPAIGELAADGVVAKLADRCAGMDGRRIAKLAALALTVRAEVAEDPSELSSEDLFAAADAIEDGKEYGVLMA